MSPDIQQQIAALIKDNKTLVVATVVKTAGSTPGKAGFKLVYIDDGSTLGTVGGGAIEEAVISECKKRLGEEYENGLLDYVLSSDSSEHKNMITVPMSCNGSMSVYYEAYKACEQVYVFGGGHVGQALLFHLSSLRFRSILVDNRKEFASKEKHP